MEANQDKLGKAALHQYRLYDIEEITIENNVHSMVKQNPLTHVLNKFTYIFNKGGVLDWSSTLTLVHSMEQFISLFRYAFRKLYLSSGSRTDMWC